jgi:hypothetical protein
MRYAGTLAGQHGKQGANPSVDVKRPEATFTKQSDAFPSHSYLPCSVLGVIPQQQKRKDKYASRRQAISG